MKYFVDTQEWPEYFLKKFIFSKKVLFFVVFFKYFKRKFKFFSTGDAMHFSQYLINEELLQDLVSRLKLIAGILSAEPGSISRRAFDRQTVHSQPVHSCVV